MPVAVYLPVPLFSRNIMKLLLKCQYAPQYPVLAACHFIFTVKYRVISLQVNASPGVTLFLYLNMHTHPYTERETSWNCLISPSFNYLPWCPWDRAKGSVLMRGGSIEKKDKVSALPHLCLPFCHLTTCFHLLASSYLMVKGSDCVCLLDCVSGYP